MLYYTPNHGILGLNARNLLYVKPFNPKKAVAFADDKLKTKAFLAARGIPTAKMYARIETREQARTFDFKQLPDECVLKPNYGFGGEGIIILKGRKNGMFLKNGKIPITEKELRQHIEDILEGMYSVNGRRDTAFVEQILIPHSCFARFRPAGLPDIRVIVFNLVPIMAMVRIPTSVSDGKANVHLGGMGIGVDLAKGMTTHAAQFHTIIDELPHGGSPAGVQIPYWNDILLISSKIQQMTNIGYLAVDITIDEQMGPALLEVNARAGLMVQLANLSPLRARLERVKGLTVSSPEKGVRIGQDLFGGEKAKSGEASRGSKPVLGTHETIAVAGEGTTIEAPCIIDPKQERTVFDQSLIAMLNEKGAIQESDQEGYFHVKFVLGGKKLQTLVIAGDVAGDDRAIIGRRDLSGFLIDPSKRAPTTERRSTEKLDLRAIDRTLAQLDRELLLLKFLKPLNLEEERQRLEVDDRYNPVFTYGEVRVDLDDAEEKLHSPIQDSSPLGQLLEYKRMELLNRMALLRARGDATAVTAASKELFGFPTPELLRAAHDALARREACELSTPLRELLSAKDVEILFLEKLEHYSLHNWQVRVRPHLVADCTVGGTKIYLREGAYFSKTHAQALVAHEIETHILTAENGAQQPYALLRNGTAGYLDTQEGLATYNQNRIYGPYHNRRYYPAGNVLAVAFALEHSLAETRQYLQEELGYTKEKALSQAISVKRGLGNTAAAGGLSKSLVYFRGLMMVEEFVRNSGDLRKLYMGKMGLQDLPLIENIADMQPPLLLPDFLREEKPGGKKKRAKK